MAGKIKKCKKCKGEIYSKNLCRRHYNKQYYVLEAKHKRPKKDVYSVMTFQKISDILEMPLPTVYLTYKTAMNKFKKNYIRSIYG